MKEKKIPPKSVIFYKLYLVNIAITIVFICLIAVICSAFSFRMILDNMMAFHNDMMAEKSSAMDERIRQLDETVNVMIGEENVFKLIMTDEADYERPTVLLKIIRNFQNICSNNSLIEGICLVDVKRGIAITEKTKTPIPKGLPYEAYRKQNAFLLHETDDGKQLEFIKLCEPVQGEKEVYIILTIDEEAFTGNLLVGSEAEQVKSYLLTDAGALVSVDGVEEPGGEVRKRLQNLEAGYEKAGIGGQNLILYKYRSKVSDLSLAVVQDYTYLERQAGSVKRMIIVASVLMIAVATIIIYLCSLYAYKPLKLLGHKVSGMAKKNGGQKKYTNEYSLIEDVVNELQTENEYALPSVVRDSIGRLVTGYFDEDRFEHLKRILHQDMGFEWNILIVTECERQEEQAKITVKFRDFIEREREIGGFFAGLNGNRLVGICNTSLSYDVFIDKIRELKASMESEDAIGMTCCVSREFKNPENMNLIYSETLQTLERKFFTGKNTLIYETASKAEYKSEYYSQDTENRLTRYVAEGKSKEAGQLLDTLIRELSSHEVDIRYTRFVIFRLCNHLIQNVMELGAKLPRDYNEKAIFQSVFDAESIHDLEAIAGDIIRSCLESFKRQEKVWSPNVEKAAVFIADNYQRDLSLDDVAGAVFLSSGYLSIIFKEETGYTVLEYITYIRMQKAKDLLLKIPAVKVKDIAAQLGYNNVQSFIRYFKKYYGETPMAFRNRCKGETGAS